MARISIAATTSTSPWSTPARRCGSGSPRSRRSRRATASAWPSSASPTERRVPLLSRSDAFRRTSRKPKQELARVEAQVRPLMAALDYFESGLVRSRTAIYR